MNKENRLVSIIVRTKDRPELLKRALQSVAAQTYRPTEVVLVNDGGCDLDIEEIKAILGDVSLNYIRLEENTGRAHAGNVGIENAKGEYIGFLDDDDEFYPEHVVTLVSFLEQSDYKVAYTDTKMIVRDFAVEEKQIIDVNEIIFSRDFSYKELLVGNYIPFNSICFSREILDFAGKIDESLDLYEDWDFLIRIGQKYPFYHIKNVTAIYNQWSRDQQINQADAEYMKAMHLRIIGKHHEKITPEIILEMRHEKERIELELNTFKDRYNASKAELSKTSVSLEEKDIHIFRLQETIKKKDNYASQLEGAVREKDDQIMNLENTLNMMRSTLGWQMLESFRRFREKNLPHGTRRRKVYELAIKSFKIFKNEGIRAFFKKIQYKLKYKIIETHSRPKESGTSDLLPPDVDKLALMHFPSKRNFSVLFLKCEWAGLTNHYRVFNMVEYLKLNGIHAEVIDLYDLPSKIPHVYKFDLILIHRIPMNLLLDSFIRICKELKMIVIFDLDDYLFEPSIIHLIEWVNHTQSTEREQLIEHIKQCKQTFEACDYFICPTDFLAKKAEEAGKEAHVIRNGFNKELMHISLKILKEKDSLKVDNTIRIGYFSGTKTHQKDFLTIALAIVRILNEYNNARFSICGLLDLDHRFDVLLHKIEKDPFVPIEQLPHYIAKFDINIAPLEIGNIFCEAKSELKYFYAGMLKIPTVATPTDAFRFAIQHGENGFLASTEEEWYLCLKTLIENSSFRKSMGEKAFSHVMNTYIPEILANKVKIVYEQIIDKARAKYNISKYILSVNFIVSDVADNFHRYAHLLEIAEILSKNGHFVRFYFYKPASGIQNVLNNSQIHIVQGMENILSSDVLVCTDPHNSSVIAYQNRNKTTNLVYFKMDKDYGEIPYQWSNLFKVIPYSFSYSEIADKIENTVWKTAGLRKS